MKKKEFGDLLIMALEEAARNIEKVFKIDVPSEILLSGARREISWALHEIAAGI